MSWPITVIFARFVEMILVNFNWGYDNYNYYLFHYQIFGCY